MKKILYVHHAGDLGGAPRSLFLLLTQLDLEKYDSKLLCISQGPVLDLFHTQKVPLIIDEKIFPFHGSTVVAKWSRYVYKINTFKTFGSYFEAKKVIESEKPDIIHLNSSCLCFFAKAAKSVNKNIKIICHIREPVRKSLFGAIIRYVCYKNVDQFIAIDSFSAESMKTKNNIQIVYNPVDLNLYRPSEKSNVLKDELNLDDKAVVFLFLARVAPGNGVLELIDLASSFQNTNPDFHFVITGLTGRTKDAYTKKVSGAAENKSNVHLMGFRTDVVDLIASSEVVVIPFTEPHFARAGMEAAAMGKPCIGANIGGVRDCIVHEKTGYLYNNETEFRSYSEKLGTNMLIRRQMGENALSFARENFDIKKSAQKVFINYTS